VARPQLVTLALTPGKGGAVARLTLEEFQVIPTIAAGVGTAAIWKERIGEGSSASGRPQPKRQRGRCCPSTS
jgi:hypothetical protein